MQGSIHVAKEYSAFVRMIVGQNLEFRAILSLIEDKLNCFDENQANLRVKHANPSILAPFCSR